MNHMLNNNQKDVNIIHVSRIFHYKPCSYWGTPMAHETPQLMLRSKPTVGETFCRLWSVRHSVASAMAQVLHGAECNAMFTKDKNDMFEVKNNKTFVYFCVYIIYIIYI